jgi:hypothetical protein
LLGSATGDETVSGPYTAPATDASIVYHAEGESGTLLDADVNGDGAVNTKDLSETAAAYNHTVGATPPQSFPQFQLFAGTTAATEHAIAITQMQVQALLPQAIAAWQTAGLDAPDVRELQGVSVQVVNLGTSILGLETGGAITINQTAAGNNWYVNAGTSSSPAAEDVDLLTVLEHELGHVIGLSDNTQPGDIMDITLGPGVRRSPSAADLTTIAGAAVDPQPTRFNRSVSSATVDAALASIVTAAVQPATPAGSMGLVSGPWATPRKREQSAHLARPCPNRIASLPFFRKTLGMGRSSALRPGSRS